MYPSTVNLNISVKKHEEKKKDSMERSHFSYMGLKGSEYHAIISVSQSTLTHTPHTHIN